VGGRGAVFVNPDSGGGNDLEEFRTAFEGHAVIECAPDELSDRVRTALHDAGPAFVGIAGGDGSIRCAVETVLANSPQTPLLAIPAGTRNHFAHDVGVDDLAAAAAAADGGVERRIDVGAVNDARFVNNSSIGVYPRLVAHREARETKMPKQIAAILAAWHQLRRGRRLHVEVDGTPVQAWAVFVGNNCYGDSLRDLTGRDRLDEGVLDVRVAHADRRLSRLRIFGAVLFGRVEQSPLIERRSCATARLDLGHIDVDVALDGEVTTLTSPLEYRSLPSALTVLAPAAVSDEHP